MIRTLPGLYVQRQKSNRLTRQINDFTFYLKLLISSVSTSLLLSIKSFCLLVCR